MFEHIVGRAGEFHQRPFPTTGGTRVWRFDVTHPALVLGARHTLDVVDAEACLAADVDVVTRRSGGAAVLLEPDGTCWVDVVVPAGDDQAIDDVRASMCWLGDRWVAALVDAAPALRGRLTVHRGGLVASPWSDLVCFAGIGPGEVLLDGRKLVGISQRRTRDGARFQCALPIRDHRERLVGLLAAPHPDPADLPPIAVVSAPMAAAAVEALVGRL